MAYRNYSTAVSHIVDASGQGDFTTIQAAINAASSNATILIRPGTYTENLTLKSGVNLVSWDADGFNAQVKIVGKMTMTAAGSVSICGLYLQTNGDYIFSATGSNAFLLIVTECYINCTNFSCVNFTNSNASTQVVWQNVQGDLATTGISIWSSTGSGLISLQYCYFTNSGNSLTANSSNGTSISMLWSAIGNPLSITAAPSAGISYCGVDSSAGNQTAITMATSGTLNLQHCQIGSGTASAISIGAGTTVTGNNNIISSSNANAVTGLGAYNYTCAQYTGISSVTNASSQTGGPINTGSISFDNGANKLSNYVQATTFTPVLKFGGGTTGITYTTQFGKYQRIGNAVSFHINIVLSNKGSSSGAATITGLPITSAADSAAYEFIFDAQTITGPAATTYYQAELSGSSATLTLLANNALTGATSSIADTNFSNTTILRISGTYFV